MKLEVGNDFARAVDDRLGLLLNDSGESGMLEAASRHLCLAPGARRLRPRLVLGVGQLLGVKADALVDLAAAVEAIHGASLLHDDVVDEGTLRRGIATANARFGNDVAVLAGDFTLVRAFGALRRYPPVLTDRAIALVEEMTRAAILEVESRGRTDLSLEQWRRIADGKCGALFGYCCTAAAIVAGRPELSSALDEFGRRMGIAFQMADDLRDLVDESLGKDRFADLRNRNPSFVLSSLPERMEQELKTLWSHVLIPQAQTAMFAKKLERTVEDGIRALDAELNAVVAVWTGAGLPEEVAEEICRAIRAQLGKREDA